MKSRKGFARLAIILTAVACVPIFPQQAPQPPAPTDVIRWIEGAPGAETLHLPNVAANIKMLTANGIVVAAAVDHAAGDVDLWWYGNSILRAQIKVANTTSNPVSFDPLATELRDSGHLLTPLSFSDILKLAPPSQSAGPSSSSGPGVYNPGGAGPGAPEQPDLRREAERAHAQQIQPQTVGAPTRGNPVSASKQSRKALAVFYAARRVEPGQFLIGYLYFKAPKLSKEFVLRIPAGQTVYEIPFSNPK